LIFICILQISILGGWLKWIYLIQRTPLSQWLKPCVWVCRIPWPLHRFV
jgi:hypothetical protein